jgi:hypothetical protein
MPPRRVTLPSHGAKMSSLPLLHLSVTFHPVTSPLEPKLKHHYYKKVTAITGRPPSPDRRTTTLHYYKKVISILATLSTTQSRLYFASSQTRAPQHQSSTRHCRSLSPSSHTHHPPPGIMTSMVTN